MYQPTLGRFLSRDPLGEGGVDVLYDNNDFGDWLTEMRNTYGYVSNNPVNFVDPSGLYCERFQWCGPEVTEWFLLDMMLFRQKAHAFNELSKIMTWYSSTAIRRLDFRRYALQADYKARTFNDPRCPNACPNTVTLCGLCVKTNQLGNIIYGILAADFGLIQEARDYGRGESPWYYRWFGATGPIPLWTEEGEAYRETAFDIGIAVANGGDLCSVITMTPSAPVNQGTDGCTPCPASYHGHPTDFNSPPSVDESGNLPVAE